MDKARLNATIPHRINDMLIEYANEYGLSKSGAVAIILQQYFEQREIIQRSKEWLPLVEQLEKLNKSK